MLDLMSTSTFGINDQLLLWAFVSSMVMYIAPAIAALIYLMIEFRRRAEQPGIPEDVKTETQKAA
jgi:hypothetical protein